MTTSLLAPSQSANTNPSSKWRHFVMAAAALAVAFTGTVAAPSFVEARPAPDSFADLAEKLLPSVVNIATVQNVEVPQERNGRRMPNMEPGSPMEEFFKEFFERNQRGRRAPRQSRSLGSGFVIDADGYVVTNNHVIDGADEVTVRLTDGREYVAELLGRDPQTDLALLKIDAKGLTPVEFGDSDEARVGDWVLTIGNPFGLGGTVTAGIVSARQRDINAGPYDDFIQTDASINRGNSGGPMFDMDGNVVGVNTAIYSPTGGNVGIGFAIPSNQASRVIAQLKEFGKTRRGWLGVRIQPVTDDVADSLGMDEATGALVSSVNPNSPADKGGVESGDIILEFNGTEVEEMRELPRIVADTAIGKEVPVQVLRNGKRQTLSITIGELPQQEMVADAGEPEAAPEPVEPSLVLGMELQGLTTDLRVQYELPEDMGGVLVVDVDRGSDAAQKNLRPRDIIVRVSNVNVNSPAEIKSQIDAASAAERGSVLLYVRRGDDYFHVAVKLEDA